MKKIRLLLISAIMLVSVNYLTAQYKIGDKVQDFNLKNVDGKMVSLADYKDAKGFIVIFSCNHCPVVQKYENRMKALHAAYASKGFPVVAINPNDEKISPGDSYAEMQKRYKAQGFKFAYLWDDTQKVAKRFGAERTPHVYIVTKESGDFRLAYIGAIDNNADNAANADKQYVKDALDALLKNKELAVTETKAVGCSIKWRN